MMKLIWTIIATLALFLGAGTAPGCETVEGFGQDVEDAGEGIQGDEDDDDIDGEE